MEELKSEIVLDFSLSRSLAKHTAEEKGELRTDKAYILLENVQPTGAAQQHEPASKSVLHTRSLTLR